MKANLFTYNKNEYDNFLFLLNKPYNIIFNKQFLEDTNCLDITLFSETYTKDCKFCLSIILQLQDKTIFIVSIVSIDDTENFDIKNLNFDVFTEFSNLLLLYFPQSYNNINKFFQDE